MKNIKIPKNAKLVLRPCHPALKIAVTALIVFSTAALIALGWFHGAIGEQTQALAEKAAAIEHANSELQDRVSDPASIENVLKTARDELGLVDPDTVLIDPKG